MCHDHAASILAADLQTDCSTLDVRIELNWTAELIYSSTAVELQTVMKLDTAKRKLALLALAEIVLHPMLKWQRAMHIQGNARTHT